MLSINTLTALITIGQGRSADLSACTFFTINIRVCDFDMSMQTLPVLVQVESTQSLTFDPPVTANDPKVIPEGPAVPDWTGIVLPGVAVVLKSHRPPRKNGCVKIVNPGLLMSPLFPNELSDRTFFSTPPGTG